MQEQLKILMLEDNAADAEIAQRFLLKEKPYCEIRLVMNKEAYLQALDQFQPDIILSDHSLPQFNSYDALAAARERFRGIPFIMLTGAVSEEFAVDIIKLGADDYILKDRLNRLPAAIDVALKQRRFEKEKTAAAQKLEESEEKYRTLVEHAFDGIIIYSPDGTILDCNHIACSSMGYIQDELKGLNIMALFFKEDLIARPLYFETLKAGQPTLDYRRLKRKDGSHIEMEIGTKMMPDGNMMAIGRDITERKAAEQKIIESETNLRTIFENTSEGFLLMDRDGTVKAFNNTSGEFAFSLGERKIKAGNKLYDFLDEPRKVFFKEVIAKVLNSETVQYERSYEQANNNTRYIDFSVAPVIDNGKVTGICITGRDISERKKADIELKKNYSEKLALAERMSTILNTLPANIALLDDQGVIIEVNDAWKKFADRNGFIGNNYTIGDNYLNVSASATGTEKKDGHTVAEGIKKVLDKQINDFTFEYPCHSPGEKRWFRLVVTPLQQKEKTGVVVMHINITDQKKSEQALQATLKELSDYKIALDESSIVSITDQQGIITYVNDNFCRISKYSPEELLGKEHRVVNSGFHDKDFIKNLWETISNGETWRNEVRNKAKDGTLYWVDATIVPFLNEKGKPVQFVAINKDLTEKKLMEQEIQEQKVQEHKKIIRAMIKAQEKERNHIGQELHDNINQILASTKLYLSMATSKDEQLKELIKYPMDLIDNSISEIRLLSSKHVTPQKNIHLEDLIQSLLDKLQHSSAIKTSFSYKKSNKPIDDDLKLNIYRIIQEKINNVVKHADADNVYVSIEAGENAVHINVTDDGKGFDIKDKRNGIGISNMINRVESFNGEMIIDSTPGKGCKVNITIPY